MDVSSHWRHLSMMHHSQEDRCQNAIDRTSANNYFWIRLWQTSWFNWFAANARWRLQISIGLLWSWYQILPSRFIEKKDSIGLALLPSCNWIMVRSSIQRHWITVQRNWHWMTTLFSQEFHTAALDHRAKKLTLDDNFILDVVKEVRQL